VANIYYRCRFILDIYLRFLRHLWQLFIAIDFSDVLNNSSAFSASSLPAGRQVRQLSKHPRNLPVNVDYKI
jgi:hypothetical protein